MRIAIAGAIPVVACLTLTAIPVYGHRLDEYLQGTILSVGKNRLEAQMILTPGVAVYSFVFSSIDTDGDGTISGAEQRAYAGRVLQDLAVRIDGRPVTPRLRSIRFPAMDDLKEGRGEIELDFDAELPAGGHNRKLTLENHHQSWISAYQVNCLVPHDPDILIAAQKRNYTQSNYELDYVQKDAGIQSLSFSPPSGWLGWLGALVLVPFARLVLLWRRRREV
jgi:hypothetical protein